MTKKEMKLAILNGKEQLVYEELIIKLIREKYTINQELAILRQRDSKLNEYEIYNNFVEGCKAQAKAIIEGVK